MRYSITAVFFIAMVMSISSSAPFESHANQSNQDLDWSDPTVLANGEGSNLTVDEQGRLWLAYINQADGQSNPYYRISEDNGASWSAPQSIFTSATNDIESVLVDIAHQAGLAHAVWVENDSEILYSREDNWASNQAISLSAPDDPILDTPRIISNVTGRLDVVWAEGIDGAPPNIYHTFSTDNGATWPLANKSVVHTSNPSSRTLVATADTNGKLYVVWSEGDRPGGFNSIWYAEGTPTGTGVEWSTTDRISNDERDTARPTIVIHNGVINVFFAYLADGTDEQYLYRITCSNNCTAGSNSWTEQGVTNVVSANTQDPFSISSAAVVQQGCLYTTFHGVSVSFDPENELVWSMSNCTSWGQQQVTPTGARALLPTLAAEGQWLYLAYETGQSSPGRQIAFRRTRVETRLYLPITLKN